jgi:molecular chaperone DnaK
MTTYGIDLGTTYSCIAHVDNSGRPVVIKNANGDDTTPSVVLFESPDSVVVGKQAKDSAMLYPGQVAELVKRDMGQVAHYTFFGQEHTPESISALILRELARAAELNTGEQVHDVVITVPAYFGLLEREATRKAGEIAGLNVLDVLPEPVAAALDYQSLTDSSGVRHIFVYDLGGGTFDTTVIRIDGPDIQVVCTDGNHHLGGADWDRKIGEFLLTTFTEQNPDLDPGLDPGGSDEFLQSLAMKAEEVKRALSTTTTRRCNLTFGGAVAQLDLTREQLEGMTSELLERTMEITERTIATAKQKGVDRFDDVLLVGGMSLMPVISQTLKDRFGLQARLQDPHLAVAKGAALFALMQMVKVSIQGESDTDPRAAQQVADQLGISVQQVEQLASKRVAAVVPRAFGIKVVDSTDPRFETDPDQARHYIAHLLTANTPLPADIEPETFRTIADNQSEVRLEVWEQAGSVASEELEHNAHIGEGMLTGLPPARAGAPFEVVFHMTETGVLHVHASETRSGREVRFEIQIGGMDDAQVRKAASAVARYQVSG